MPPVWGDIGMIERLLSNVVENALEHTPEGGDVTVQLYTVEGGGRSASGGHGRRHSE